MTAATATSAPADAPAPAAGRARSRRWLTFRSIASWAVFLALAGLFVVFRPTMLGGFTTYAFISGVSMEPTYHTGDLAIVIPQTAYAIGDVVSYHPSADPAGQIIHRIVAGDAATGYTTQGDNRTTADPDIHTPADLVGKAVVVVPGLGWVLNALRNPLVLGGLAAILVMGLAWEWVLKPRSRDAG